MQTEPDFANSKKPQESAAQLNHLDASSSQKDMEIRELKAQLSRLEDQISKKDAEIAEYLHHLDRMNASAWWRVGKLLEKLIRVPAALLAPRARKPHEIVAPAAPHARPIAVHVSPESIILPATESDPDVSVVILSYGHVDFTLQCLASLALNAPLCSVEAIVSDDCSHAPDIDDLKLIANLRILQTPQNLGFLKHANWAVAQSRGKYVLLLNNDTELKPGAIDALVETARNTPDAGLVGPKLTYLDGRLQEAGGIVWNDASAWNYGRLDNADRPEYNYLRDADYISGAAILVPRAVWDQLEGFDESFAPAYYEDTDLAFRLRQSGFRVIYQPKSVVIHHEGISHGTDINSGIKAHQVANQTLMKERWLATLKANHFRNGANVSRARDRAKNKRIMLIIDQTVPAPDRDAGSRNMIDVMKSLQADGWIIKFWPQILLYDTVYTAKLQQMGIETAYAPWATSFDEWLLVRRDDIDLVFLSRPAVARKYLQSIRRIMPKAPIIFYGHDLHCARLRMQSRVANNPALVTEANAMEVLERQIWRDVDLVLYPSQEETDEVRRIEPTVDARTLVPFCFDAFRSIRSPTKSSIIMFVAGFAHPPNVDAAVWLSTEILPIVRRDAPLARLWIVGSDPAPAVKTLACDGIEVTGYVTEFELARRYVDARVAVVPLRIGAGVKLKVVEALYEGLPLVTTSVGAQGLQGVGAAATVVDEAEAFAAEIVRLLNDDIAWVEQARRQLDYAAANFSRRASIAAMVEATNAAKHRSERRKHV